MPVAGSELLVSEEEAGEDSDVQYSRQAGRGNPG